jgi:hypothetical protein
MRRVMEALTGVHVFVEVHSLSPLEGQETISPPFPSKKWGMEESADVGRVKWRTPA